MSEEDPFADIRGSELSNMGIMQGDGASAHYSAKERVVDDGVAFQIACDNCGQPNVVTVEWGEFVYGMNRAIPPNWQFAPQFGSFHPNVGCKACNALLMLLLKPDECARHVRAGAMARKVDMGRVQQMSQQVQSQVLAHRR